MRKGLFRGSAGAAHPREPTQWPLTISVSDAPFNASISRASSGVAISSESSLRMRQIFET